MEMKMTAGVIGNGSKEFLMRQPEVKRALERGAVIGAYMLNGVEYENGIGLWEPVITAE